MLLLYASDQNPLQAVFCFSAPGPRTCRVRCSSPAALRVTGQGPQPGILLWQEPRSFVSCKEKSVVFFHPEMLLAWLCVRVSVFRYRCSKCFLCGLQLLLLRPRNLTEINRRRQCEPQWQTQHLHGVGPATPRR